jgi:hypothetical protein
VLGGSSKLAMAEQVSGWLRSPGCVSDRSLGSSKALLRRSFAGRGGGARELNAVSR